MSPGPFAALDRIGVSQSLNLNLNPPPPPLPPPPTRTPPQPPKPSTTYSSIIFPTVIGSAAKQASSTFGLS